MLTRICGEIVERFKLKEKIPKDYDKLRQEFPNFLEQAAQQKKLVLVIDAVDQLLDQNHAHSINWLPPNENFPPNLRIITSAASNFFFFFLDQRKEIILLMISIRWKQSVGDIAESIESNEFHSNFQH
jgi:hypothetical protein